MGGLDPLKLPFDRFLNLVYGWLQEGRNEEGLAKLEHDLNLPPVEATEEEIQESPEWSNDAMAGDFMASLAARGGAGRLSVDGVRKLDLEVMADGAG